MMDSERDENLVGGWRAAAIIILLGLLAVGGWFLYEQNSKAPQSEGVSAEGLASVATSGGALEQAGSDAAEADYPVFDVVRVTRGGAGLMTGHAPPAAKVNILADGISIGQVTADARGEWVLIFSEPLKSGGLELSLQLVKSFLVPDRQPVLSKSIVVVVVPGTAKDHFINGEGEGVVVISSPRDRVGSSVILQRPGRVTAGEDTEGLGLDVLDYGDDGKAVLSGRGPAYGQIWAYIDNQFMGAAATDKSGKWQLDLVEPVRAGQHELRVDQVGDKGKVQLRLLTNFERMEPLDPLRENLNIIVQAAQDLWRISRKLVGDGFHYTLIFKTDKNQVRDPDQVYPDQLFELPPVAGK